MQYGLINSESMHSLCHFLDKNKESFDDKVPYHPLGSSHAIKYLLSGYKGGVISLYDEATPRVLISRCKMTLAHSYGLLFYDIMN